MHKIFNNDIKPSPAKVLLLVVVSLILSAIFIFLMMNNINGNNLLWVEVFFLLASGAITFACFSVLDFLVLPK